MSWSPPSWPSADIPQKTSGSSWRTCQWCTAVPCTTTAKPTRSDKRVAPGESSTEDLRQAMVHYLVLFEELLDDGDEHHPQPAAAREKEPALTDDSQQR